jgi:cellulose synthase/poly-beta-1,6-N-acetylglucosamine synthase-like glycosyltransferase
MPRVSVVMPVYNVERYVGEAVGSVLNQTFRDLELIVVDDGSADRTAAIVEGIGDERVRLIRAEHQGYVAATNRGLELATGELVARADGDDVYDPRLFQRQIEVLDANPRTAAVGAWARQFGGEQQWWQTPSDPKGIRIFLRRGCALVQPVMMRASVFHEVGGLRPVAWEDWDLWIRMAARYDLRNIPEVLVMIRWRADSVFRSPRRSARRKANLRARLTAARLLGVGVHSGLILARNLASAPVFTVLDKVAPPKPRAAQQAPPDPTIAVAVWGPDPEMVERRAEAVRGLRPEPSEVITAGGLEEAVERARESHGDVVAFLHADLAPSGEWLAEIRRAFLDPSVGAFAGPSLGAGGALAAIDRRGRLEPIDPSSMHYGDVDTLPESNVAARRELLGHGDIAAAARAAGLRLLYSPWAFVERDTSVGAPS